MINYVYDRLWERLAYEVRSSFVESEGMECVFDMLPKLLVMEPKDCGYLIRMKGQLLR